MIPADVYIQDGIAMVRMRPVDWVDTHEEQVFTGCPKEQTNVSITGFCAMCPHFKGLAVPEIGRLAARLDREEITEDMFKQGATEVLRRPSSVNVVCAYPVLRECGSFKAVSPDASPESD
jgi:hypothetical protein